MGGLSGYWSAISHLSQPVKMGVYAVIWREIWKRLAPARSRYEPYRCRKTSKTGSGV